MTDRAAADTHRPVKISYGFIEAQNISQTSTTVQQGLPPPIDGHEKVSRRIMDSTPLTITGSSLSWESARSRTIEEWRAFRRRPEMVGSRILPALETDADVVFAELVFDVVETG